MVTGTLETVMQTARAVMASLALSYEVDSGTPQNIDEVYCMAKNVYFEARHESTLGKIAVAHVTMNRVNADNWPNTVCTVVHDGPIRESWKTKKDPTLADKDRIYYPRKNRCQFSWYCDSHRDMIWVTYKNGDVIEQNMNAWRDSVTVALLVMNNVWAVDPTDGATFYYNPHIANPGWAGIYTETAVIGNHRFMNAIN
ncbi:MAG: cell wall hydrolase [Candidatus Marinimicrobia bacterium]|nr:cell wall hydrolase [Candidatus Neomarinimicrobiota bacterium]